MHVLSESFSHTPIWVYVLFAYLILRGMKSLRPREVTLAALALIPAIFTALGIATMTRRFGFSVFVFGPWLVALATGAGVGWLLLLRAKIAVDHSRGVLFRPADYSVLPLIIGSFAVKYAFGAASVIHPEILERPGFGMLEGAVYGLFAGIFIGKFANCTMRYLREPPVGVSAAGRDMYRGSRAI